MKKMITTSALAISLALSACSAFASTGTVSTVKDEARHFACADVSTDSNDACMVSMFSEVERTQKNFLKKPSVESAMAFDLAAGTLNGALAVVARTPAVDELEGRYKDLLKEVTNAQGKSLPSYNEVK